MFFYLCVNIGHERSLCNTPSIKKVHLLTTAYDMAFSMLHMMFVASRLNIVCLGIVRIIVNFFYRINFIPLFTNDDYKAALNYSEHGNL